MDKISILQNEIVYFGRTFFLESVKPSLIILNVLQSKSEHASCGCVSNVNVRTTL